MTTEAETRTPPPPTFPHRVYGANLTFIGDEGGIMAEGHMPLIRFVAAANRITRTESGCRNLLDSRQAALDEVLEGVRHCWALPVDDPWPDDDNHDWYVQYDSGVTAETPGALPVTLWEP